MKSAKKGGKGRAVKNAGVLVLSLGLGGAGMFYSKEYIEGRVNYYRSQLEKTEKMATVIVPKRRLVRGQRVTAGDLATRQIPVKFFDSNSVRSTTLDTALGQRISFDVDEGRPLLWAHLEGGQAPTFSGKVPAGLRAVTIAVDEINSFSGFLQPKDRVDFLLTHGNGDDAKTFPLLQNLEVMATGIKTITDKTGQGSKRRFNTVTVKVSDQEAKKITLAKKVGKITAMLRNPDDESPLVNRAMTVRELLGKPPVRKKVRVKKRVLVKTGPTKPAIEFIIGGGRDKKG